MSAAFPALTEHACPTVSRTIFLPLSIEKYSSKDIVSAKCFVCGTVEFEHAVDRSSPAAKGFYQTV